MRALATCLRSAWGREAEGVVEDAIDEVVVLAEPFGVDGESEALVEGEGLPRTRGLADGGRARRARAGCRPRTSVLSVLTCKVACV